MRIGKILINHLIDDVENLSVRLIVVAQTFFFLDGFALIVEIFLRHGERTHPVGFEPERKRQLICRNGLIIISAFRRGRAVHRSASFHNVLKMLGFFDVFRTLKHHMFKQMCKPRFVCALIPRTDIVINRHSHDRNRIVLIQDDAQPVF